MLDNLHLQVDLISYQSIKFSVINNLQLLTTMAEQQNYKEFISTQGDIEANIASDWGYSLHSKQYVPKPIKIKQTFKLASIQPMKRSLTGQPSPKLLKVEEELLMLQNERKLSELTEKVKAELDKGEQTQEECAAVKMMNQCIEQYNFLLEHRHIIQKNSQRARKILGIKKTKVEVLNERIQALKKQMENAGFSQMVEITKKIAQLFREYQKTMFSSKQPSLHKSQRGTSLSRSKIKNSALTSSIALINTLKLSPDLKTEKRPSGEASILNRSRSKDKKVELKDFVVLHELKQSYDGSNSMAFERKNWIQEQAMKQPRSVFIGKGSIKLTKKSSEQYTRHRLYTVIEKKSTRQLKKERLSTTITESFVPKQVMEKGRVLDDRLRQHEDVLEVWRNRIEQNKEKVTANYLRYLPKAKKFKKSLKNNPPTQHIVEEQNPNGKIEKAKAILGFRMEEVKKEMNERQKIFSTLLRKKQNKYIKIPGTQVVQQRDLSEQAKALLCNNMSSKRSSKERNLVYGSTIHGKAKQQNSEAQPEWMSVDPEGEEIYWAMCRNEKMNLLLKNHKKR